MIKCPSCGGEMSFNPGDQKVVCPYCRNEFDPKELEVKVKKSKKRETYEGKSYSCSQCGAKLMTFDDTAITFCSYCGSQAMLEDKMITGESPDFIIPFSKTKEECINAYKKAVNSSFFVPKYMKEDMVVEKFRGIYMPYAVYSSEFHGLNSSKGSKYAYRRGDYVYYNDYKIDADLDVSYTGMSFDLSSNFFDQFSQAIPFDNKGKENFNPNYLVGFYADSSNVDGQIYNEDAVAIPKDDAKNRLLKHHEYHSYGCKSVKVDLQVTDRKLGFFPVYFLAIRDKKNENVSYAVVNGQTGKVAIDLPISYKKYIIASIIVSLIMFVLINNFIVLTPRKVCGYAAVASIFSLIFSITQINQVHKRRNHLDDKGYITRDLEIKITKTNKFKYVYKEIIGVLLPVILLFADLVGDEYYYGGAIISLILVILSFKDLVVEHNLLTTNKLPQLEKRGGDK